MAWNRPVAEQRPCDTGKGNAVRPSALLCGLLAAILVVCVIAVLLCRSVSDDSSEEPTQVETEQSAPGVSVIEATTGQDDAPLSSRKHRLRRKMRLKKRIEGN